MRTGNGTQSSSSGSKPRITGAEVGYDRIYSVDGGSTGAVSSIIAQAQDTTGCVTFGGHDGTGTASIQATSWFEPVEDNGCKDGVCPVPWATIPLRSELQPDVVNHPAHYTDGKIECIEAIEAQLTSEEYRGYLKGNIAKYVWRECHKGGTESLKKARWYLDRLVKFDED
jgi:hypothetical protein